MDVGLYVWYVVDVVCDCECEIVCGVVMVVIEDEDVFYG